MNFRKIFATVALGLVLLDLVVPPVIVYRPQVIGGVEMRPACYDGHIWRYGLGLETKVEWPRFTGELVVIGLVAGLLILLATPSFPGKTPKPAQRYPLPPQTFLDERITRS